MFIMALRLSIVTKEAHLQKLRVPRLVPYHPTVFGHPFERQELSLRLMPLVHVNI